MYCQVPGLELISESFGCILVTAVGERDAGENGTVCRDPLFFVPPSHPRSEWSSLLLRLFWRLVGRIMMRQRPDYPENLAGVYRTSYIIGSIHSSHC